MTVQDDDPTRTINGGLMQLGRELPETMQAFGRLHRSAMADGALPASVKELLALAISITEGCSGCIGYHTERATKAGATRGQLLEAVGVAVAMGGGPAAVHGIEALEHIDRRLPAG
jgi:AhpD family alkylhydroperoxidase